MSAQTTTKCTANCTAVLFAIAVKCRGTHIESWARLFAPFGSPSTVAICALGAVGGAMEDAPWVFDP